MIKQLANTYKLILLGKPDVLCNGTSVKIPRSKSKGIIFYLASQDKDVSRDKLQYLFWPELKQQTAQHNLNVHLSDIRKQLPGLLESDNTYVRLSGDVSIDCKQFDQYFKSDCFDFERHQYILGLYHGDFLEGFNIGGVSDFEIWRSSMREHYLNLFIKGLIRLADYHHSRGEYQDELIALQNALQLDPLQERVYRSVMKVHYENGDFLQANAIYQKLQKILVDEIGTEPMPETQQLYNEMLERRSFQENEIHHQRQHFTLQEKTQHSKQKAKTSFVGMNEILAELKENALQKDISIVEGIEGSGKTRLLKEFADTWEGTVFWINCLSASEDLPYQPFLGAVSDYFAMLEMQKGKDLIIQKLGTKRWQVIQSLLNDGIISIDLQHDMGKVQLFDVFANLFLSIASFSPLLVVVDDIGSGDVCTLKLVEHLAVRCSSSVAFVGSVSLVYSGIKTPMISARLRSMGILRRIRMPGFTPEDVSRLLKEKSPVVSDELANWLWKIAGRNPFQLIEFANSLPEAQLHEFKAVNNAPSIPASLRDYFEPISFMLSETARVVIDIASVYGTVFPFRLLYQTGIVSEQECMDALDELADKGILISAGKNEYEFFTAIIRETVYAVLSSSRRQWLHLKIAEAIEKDDSLFGSKTKDGLLAHHFAKSSQPKRAVPYAMQAGDDAYKRSAWLDAIDYYEMVKEYADDSEFLLRHLTAVYMSAGEEAEYRRIIEAKSNQSRRLGKQGEYLVNEIEARFSKQDRVEEYRWAMIPGYVLPLNEEDMELIAEAKQLLEGHTEESYVRARLCMIVALRCCAAGDYESAAKYCVQIIDELPEFTVNEQPLVVMAHLAAGVYLGVLGRLEESIVLLERGLSLALDKEIIYAEAIIRCEYGKQLAMLNKTQEAKKQLDIALKLSRHYGLVYIEARTLFEMTSVVTSEDSNESEKLLREALHLTEITNNSQHLQIHILNELFPLLSEDDRKKWNEKLSGLDALPLQN